MTATCKIQRFRRPERYLKEITQQVQSQQDPGATVGFFFALSWALSVATQKIRFSVFSQFSVFRFQFSNPDRKLSTGKLP